MLAALKQSVQLNDKPDVAAPVSVDAVTTSQQSPQTAAQLFDQLASKGQFVGRNAAERFEGSLKAGYESLMKFQGSQGAVISLKSVDDLRQYVGLVTEGNCSDPKVSATFKELEQKSSDGVRFYLKRSGTGKPDYLRTDAAGAAVSMARAERVEWVSQTGAQGQIEASSQISGIAAADSKTAELGKALDLLEAKGYTFELSVPEKQPGEGILHKLVNSKPKELGLAKRRTLISELQSGQRLSLTLANDYRQLKLPVGVDRKQVLAISQYVTSPTVEQEKFKASFANLQKDGAVVTARALSGDEKGMLLNACDRGALLNLEAGGEVVVLTKDGRLHSANTLEDITTLELTGSIPSKLTSELPLGTNPTSDNLFMTYYAAPFDPIKKGNYDDLPLRLTQVGSSSRVDLVTLHSDLPDKKNLHLDRVQRGKLESLQQMDPKQVLSDPKVFEDFIYHTISDNLSDGRIRLLVGGHGGAEKGLVPDGKDNNAQADHAMGVDEFSKAITQALDRVQEGTGKRPHIDNLVLCSCLMGNSSLIHALSQNADVGILCASPEIMQGSSPTSMVEYLNDPKTSKASSEEFARFLVDEIMETPSSPGGSIATHHADTYGAYQIDKAKGVRFQKSLSGFFQACLDSPKDAARIKAAISDCPTYGQNKIVNLMFNVQERDIIQVAEKIAGDARIQSQAVKSACKELIAATEDQVLVQKMTKNYQGRRGPTICMPVDRFDYDKKFGETELLKSTRYDEFLNLLFDTKVHLDFQGSLFARLHEVMAKGNEVLSAPKDSAPKDSAPKDSAPKDSAPKDSAPNDAAGAEKTAATPAVPAQSDPAQLAKNAEVFEILGKMILLNVPVAEVHGLESRLQEASTADKVAKVTRTSLRFALTSAVAIAAGAIAAIPGAVIGGILGAKSGLSGHSALSRSFGGKQEAEKSKAGSPADQKTAQAKTISDSDSEVAKSKTGSDSRSKGDESNFNMKDYALEAGQLALLPSEYVGTKVNQEIGYRYGSTCGRVAGLVTGALSGVVGGCLSAFGLVGGLSGWYAHKKASQFLGEPDPGKNHPTDQPELDKLAARLKELAAPPTPATDSQPTPPK
jgi:hypothetical protein